MNKSGILISVLSPILVPSEPLQVVFPTVVWHVGVHTDFVSEELLGLQCWTKIWAT